MIYDLRRGVFSVELLERLPWFVPPSSIIHVCSVVFSFDKVAVADEEQPVNASFGERDVPLGA